METNDVVTIVATTGAEYVGKLLNMSDDSVVLADPHIVTPDGQKLGFMPTVAMTGQPRIGKVTFNKSGIILVVPTAEEVAKEYIRASSGILL